MIDPKTTGPIDFHVHAFADDLAARALQRLAAGSNFHPYFDGTVAGLQGAMAKAGIAHAVLQPVATKPAQVAVINQWCLEVAKLSELSTFGALHPDMPADLLAEQVGFLKKHGFRGVKLHPEYQNFYPDENRLEPIYRALEQAGLALLLHAGWDAAYSTPQKATPGRLRQILESFPKLRIIAAHMGGLRERADVERELVGRKIGLDTAYCAGECPRDWFQEIVRAHGANQIFFASDAPWGEQAAHLQFVRNAGLFPLELERIEYKNALEILV